MASTASLTEMTLTMYDHSTTGVVSGVKVYSELVNMVSLPWTDEIGTTSQVQIFCKAPGTPDRTFVVNLSASGVGDVAAVTSTSLSAAEFTMNMTVGDACTTDTLASVMIGDSGFIDVSDEFGVLVLDSGLIGITSGNFETSFGGVVLPGKAYTVVSTFGTITVPMVPYATYNVWLEYTNDFESTSATGPSSATDIQRIGYTTLKIPQVPGNGESTSSYNLFDYLDI